MVKQEQFRKLALLFDEAEELPHFEKASFRVKKKIFATLDVKNKRACLKLSAVHQSVFAAYDKSVVYAVPNAWGKQGWTFVELSKVKKEMLEDMLTCAYCEVAPEKLAVNYRKD